jgi:hypothetical protein
MKDAEDVKLKRRREMIENRMERARQMVGLRLLPEAPRAAEVRREAV